MKRKIIILLLLVTTVISVVGCNSPTTQTKEQNNNKIEEKEEFNEDKAKEESKAQLEKFFNLYENQTNIAKNIEMDKIKSFVNDKLTKYMTKDFQNDVMNKLSQNMFTHSDETFFLGGYETVYFYNGYDIYSPTVDKENKTVVYQLKASTGKEKGIPPTTYVYVEMKEENGEWKINKIRQD